MISQDQSSGHGGGGDVELNLAPIIDCFVVLVTFMLISASFLSIGILESSVAAPTASNDKAPDYMLEMKILSNGDLQMDITGKKTIKRRVPASELEKTLAEYKTSIPELQTGTLTPPDDLPFEKVIQVLDKTKKIVPQMSLGGV